MNRTRLDASIGALSAAQVAYDAALRRHADATRAALATGGDAAASTALRRADAELATARTSLSQARVDLDVVRASELATLETADSLLGFIRGNEVLGLFPVGMEARLEPGRLRIRVWPDAISTATHDPRLTEAELAATKRYWRAVASAGGEENAGPSWREFADGIGVTRAAWAAHILTPLNEDALSPSVEPEFPIVAMHDDAAPFVPRAAVLPDRWIAIGLRDGARVFSQVGAAIPLDLAVGLDTTPSEGAGLHNSEGESIQLPPRMRWMTDFTLAVQAGMAFDIALASEVDRLDELFVVGVRVTQTPSQNSIALEELFAGHRFSRGLAFVAQDTPTNNSASGGSGMPSRAERIDTAFAVERRPRGYTDGLTANGLAAARAFGIGADAFAPVAFSGATALDVEPTGFEEEAARAMQTVLWQVTVGATLEDFLLLPSARADAMREHFCGQVRAAGPVPAIRVGRQPYGVLPVTTIDGFVPRPGEAFDPRMLPLLRAARTWFAMRRQSHLFEGSSESALRQLGRSMHLFAETTQQVAGNTVANRWQTLARSLAVSSRNSIKDDWRNMRIIGTVDGVPVPVERVIVDETTATELGALATASPLALLQATPPASLLVRMARHATLLEWSRFARTAIEAVVDIASRRNLASKAQRDGSDIYIRVLADAFRRRPPVEPTGPLRPIHDLGTTRAPASAPSEVTRRRVGDTAEPPEPPEPPVHDPHPHPPLPPVGDPAISAAERDKIRALVGSIAEPLPSCPGAPRLTSFRTALSRLSQLPGTGLEAEFFRTLDLCNHRLDAWFTSLSTRRLDTLRTAAPTGLVLGGWGCLQDVRRADSQELARRAEFIHAPSLDQAAAAAVLRSGALRAQNAGSSHADIDLSSRRVRLARWILEGIRNGRSMSELLGTRFERALKGTPAETQLDQLRTRFPGFAGKGVLDGLRLQAELSTTDPHVAGAVAEMDASVDAVADALTAEAVYQLVRGNPGAALVNLEALANGAPPPELRVTETPRSGIQLTHRVVLALPQGSVAPGWRAATTPRAAAEPLLDAWCGLVLGPATDLVLSVDGEGALAETVTLSTLPLCAIDVVFAGRGDAGELMQHVLRAAAAQSSEFVGTRVRIDSAWRDLTGQCDAIARMLTHAQPLRPEAFDPPTELTAAIAEDFGDLPIRVAQAASALTAVRDDLQSDPVDAAIRASALGIHVPGLVLGAAPTQEQRQALLAAIESRLAGTGTPRDRLRALFGGELPGISTFLPHSEDALATALAAPASLLDGDTFSPSAWLDAAGRVHPKAAALAEVLLRQDIVRGMSGSLLIAQAPWQDGDRWIGTAFKNSTGAAPAGRLSVLIHAPVSLAAGEQLGGLLIDAWTETIPAQTRDTAMALRFNNAGTRAPQTVLLAVHPDPSNAWTTDTLVEILQHTLMLARLRVQPSNMLSTGGLMPSAWLGQRPGTSGVSFEL
jgi:hypothetical protein